MDASKTTDVAHIGRSVTVKRELSGREDLFIDGQVEGTIELKGNSLTIGPHGQVKANVNAKDVTVQGKLEGNIQASERAELKKTAVAVGDIITQRVAIEEEPKFARAAIRDVEPLEVVTWFKELRLAPTTKASIRSVLSVCFDLAALHKFIPAMGQNPMTLVKIKRVTKRKKKITEVTVEGFQALLNALPEPLNIMVLVDRKS